jgi:ABC-type transport system involved in multi-copper enzyme maturation permease subunit
VSLPFVADAFRLRGRRIWALARLSFKEALRRRILWVFFAVMVGVFLFAGWFLDPKPEKQVHNYVWVVYLSMTLLTLFTAGLLASFSIPADIRSQTIHTIVTKPVERFEIILGRFLGYSLLMTLVMVVMTGASLIYMVREIHPEAQQESMRARVPIYGNLRFVREGDPDYAGINVGREWDYRKYITGGDRSRETAIWEYSDDAVRHLANWNGNTIPCEFSFDIFRTLKPKLEGEGVICSFAFQTRLWNKENLEKYRQELNKPSDDLAKTQARLAEEYGVFEIRAKEIADYHTQYIDIPAALFKNIPAEKPQRQSKLLGSGEDPALRVIVHCQTGGQYVGMAKYDFYVLDSEGAFGWNFYKGVMGLWLSVLLVIGISVTLSTYLSGVISFIVTGILYGLGMAREFIAELASGKAIGGGPMESFYRLTQRQGLIAQLDPTPASQLAQTADVGFRGIFYGVMKILPDVDRFDWTDYVSEGFNISVLNLVFPSCLLLLGYLVPCALIAYYLMKSREVAS